MYISDEEGREVFSGVRRRATSLASCEYFPACVNLFLEMYVKAGFLGFGFTNADGWELLMWCRTLTLLNKKKESVTSEYKRPYLKHKETGVSKLSLKSSAPAPSCLTC